ncbi:DUF6504 family protein [Nocardioides pacificus]
MRRYDDPVEVRKGLVGGPDSSVEGPEQFLWHGRLWKVSDVLAHWVETGSWWQSSGVRAVIGSEESLALREGEREGEREGGEGADVLVAPDLLCERELWRVEAGRGAVADRADGAGRAGRGVFDLAFDWADGGWRLVGCVD